MTTEDSGFLAAGGILPWHEGDELPEDIIRRYRGDCSNIEAERDAARAEVERLWAERVDQVRLWGDHLDRMHQELAAAYAEVERLQSQLTTTLVACRACGSGVQPRQMVFGSLCPACAEVEIEVLRKTVVELREHHDERVCEWHAVEDNWGDWHYEGACEGAWMAGYDVDDRDTPEDCGYIYCPTCGGKIVFIGGDDDCEEGDGD